MNLPKILAAALLLAAPSVFFAAVSDDRPVIRIGVLSFLSGDCAFMGESYRHALQIAQEDKAKAGFRYELLFEDCGYSHTKAALAARKLLSTDRVHALITMCDSFGSVVAPIAAKAGVPHFCYGTSAAIADGKTNFILNAMPADQAAVLAQALGRRNLKKLALLTIKDTYTMAQRDAIKKLAPQRGLEIAADFPYNADEKDFRTVIAKAKSLKPDLYVISAFTPTLEMLVRQMRDAGVTNFSGMETFDNGSDARMFEGLWYVGPANPAADFTHRFKATFKGQMVVGSSHLYDSFMILASAFETGGTANVPSSSQVIANLTQIKSHTGVSGLCVYDGKGIFHSPAVEKMIKNGQPEELR